MLTKVAITASRQMSFILSVSIFSQVMQALDLRPSSPCTEPKSRKNKKFILNGPKIPFFSCSLGPVSMAISDIQFPPSMSTPLVGGGGWIKWTEMAIEVGFRLQVKKVSLDP